MSMNLSQMDIPQHLGIIMDGNGRWAQQRGLPRIAGHQQGVQAVKRTVEDCAEIGVKILTLYTFSTENWCRPKSEVDFLSAGEKIHNEEASLQRKVVDGNSWEPGRLPVSLLTFWIRRPCKQSELLFELVASLNLRRRTGIMYAMKNHFRDLIKKVIWRSLKSTKPTFFTTICPPGSADGSIGVRAVKGRLSSSFFQGARTVQHGSMAPVLYSAKVSLKD